ncbi:MAG TPA: response regulator [Nitrospiraceae bacterium]|nr:response regulator [Nitrospiraceae bacterium]
MKSVLIVEDSTTTRSFIRAVIEEIDDFSTVEASSGFDALKTLPTQHFDLIITDINMPDINGFELINFVKGNPNYKDIPMIIVTTERSEENKKRGLAMGAFGYIIKPFKSKELQDMVKGALNL